MFKGEKLYPLSFNVKQVVFEVCGVRFGGLPGFNPVVAVGSLFYIGDKKLISADEGIIDKEATIKEIEAAKKIAEEYGIALAIDLIGNNVKVFENTLAFIVDTAEVPVFIDAPSPEIRIVGYKLAYEIGVNDKCIANGLFINSPEEEYKAIRDYNIEASVIMGFDPAKAVSSLTPNARLKLLEEKLLPKARSYGIDKLLLDAVVLDPSSISLCGSAIRLFKDKLGLPSGAAPANALGVVSKKDFGVEGVVGILGGSAVFMRLMGADFILYGPLKRIKYVAPALSMVDSLLGYLLRLEGTRLGKDHPLSRVLKRLHRLFSKTSVNWGW